MSPASQPFLFSISFTTMVSGWDHSLISDKRLHAVLRIILSHPNFYYSILSFGSIIIYGPDIWINFFFFFFFFFEGVGYLMHMYVLKCGKRLGLPVIFFAWIAICSLRLWDSTVWIGIQTAPKMFWDVNYVKTSLKNSNSKELWSVKKSQ